eukprot:405067-Rhodomonas_salina.3
MQPHAAGWTGFVPSTVTGSYAAALPDPTQSSHGAGASAFQQPQPASEFALGALSTAAEPEASCAATSTFLSY